MSAADAERVERKGAIVNIVFAPDTPLSQFFGEVEAQLRTR